MNATLTAVRITGRTTDHLSLHVNPARARAALLTAGRTLWSDRFGYASPVFDDDSVFTNGQVIERLGAEGWHASVDEVPVEL